MSRILYIWELGDDLGHLSQFNLLANELIANGHTLYFAVKNLVLCSHFDWPDGITFFQVPLWRDALKRKQPSYCHADVLLQGAFGSEEQLATTTDMWRFLFETIKPDVVLFDHAPCALFASSDLTIPRVIYSRAFLCPPAGTTRSKAWAPGNDERILYSESKLIDIVNAVAKEKKLSGISAVNDLYDVDSTILNGFSDTDFYQQDRPAHAIYTGIPMLCPVTKTHEWTDRSGPKTLVLVQKESRQSSWLLEYLSKKETKNNCIFVSLDRTRTTFSDNILEIGALLRQASSVVCNGDDYTIALALAYGKPLILVPRSIEEFHTTVSLQKLGIAMIVGKKESRTHLHKKLDLFFKDSSFHDAVNAYKDKNHTKSTLCSQTIVNNVIKKLTC